VEDQQDAFLQIFLLLELHSINIRVLEAEAKTLDWRRPQSSFSRASCRCFSAIREKAPILWQKNYQRSGKSKMFRPRLWRQMSLNSKKT